MVSLDASGLLFILFRCPCIHVLDQDSIGLSRKKRIPLDWLRQCVVRALILLDKWVNAHAAIIVRCLSYKSEKGP
jgi:hypothetical protein